MSNVLFDVECNLFEKIEVKEELSDISVVKQEVPEILYSLEENEIGQMGSALPTSQRITPNLAQTPKPILIREIIVPSIVLSPYMRTPKHGLSSHLFTKYIRKCHVAQDHGVKSKAGIGFL